MTELYRETRTFPREEVYGLTSQLRRAAVSIPSNISEGAGRDSDPQFKHFLEIAMGSSNELQTQIELSKRLKYLSDEDADKLLDEALQIYKMIFAYYNTL